MANREEPIAQLIREHVVHCPYGQRVALFLTKLYGRIIRPGLQALDSHLTAQAPPPLQKAFAAVDAATEAMIREARLTA